MPSTPHTLEQALPDGTTVHVRPLRPDDDQRLLDLWDRTSQRSRRLRFHGAFRLDEESVQQFVDYDPTQQYALVATKGRGEGEAIIGVARWVRDATTPSEAEFAILVADDHQGRGLGTVLVRQLAVTAHEAGIDTLSGDVLAENKAMLRVIRKLGLAHADHSEQAVVRSDLGLDLGEEFLAVGDRADARASRAATSRFLRPRSVAIVGASRSPTTVGGLLVDNVLSARFTGRVHLVNPTARRILQRTVHASLSDLPEVPELVVVAVPADAVNDVVDEAGALGCRAVCVISSGFAEAGTRGRTRQRDLMERAHAHGLRLVGPNSMGLVNTDPGVGLDASLAETTPASGGHAIAAQSGALGMAMLRAADRRGLGVSSFVSLGNAADLSANDLLQSWELDDRTSAVLMHLESFGDPRRFARIARRVSRSRPVVVVKAGTSVKAAQASAVPEARSQVGTAEVDALFAQTGVIRTTNIPELFDVAELLPLVDRLQGCRVGIVGNAGGPAVVAADACETHGLEVVDLSDDTRAKLESALPDHYHVGNPMDLVVGADPEHFSRALSIVACSGDVDVVMAIHAQLHTDPAASANAITTARQDVDGDVPIIAISMDDTQVEGLLGRAGVTTFAFPEAAARALGHIGAHAQWRRRPLGEPRVFDDIDVAAGRTVVDAVLAELRPVTHPAGRAEWLSWGQVQRLLAAYGVDQPRSVVVNGRDGAARAQRTLDAPVAVKVLDPVLRRTTTGGVELGRRSPRAAAAAVTSLRKRFPEATNRVDQRFLVQEMVAGVEMVVGVDHHPSFGPVLVTGAGGPNLELIRDLTARITPLTDRDATEMIDSLRMRPLLDGYRGGPPGDMAAVRDLLGRVSAMVEDLPEIIELDFNPVFVQPDGLLVADAHVRVQALPRPTDRPIEDDEG